MRSFVRTPLCDAISQRPRDLQIGSDQHTRAVSLSRGQLRGSVRAFSSSLFPSESPEQVAAALTKMQKMAFDGDLDAKYALGLAHLNGEMGLTRDLDVAKKWLFEAAEGGNCSAQYKLGTFFLEGKGPDNNPQEAVKWLKMAAEQNEKAAMYQLGVCYEGGVGVEQDFEEAALQFAMAAKQEDLQSLMKLANAYIAGRGVPKDMNKAVDHLRKPARKGVVEAQFVLGYILINADTEFEGVKGNISEGLDSMEQAAEAEFPNAQHYLGWCYLDGHCVEQNSAKATEWFQKAALAGHGPSQLELYKLFSQGEGLEKEARRWLERAAENGVEDAKKRLEELKKEWSGKK